MRRRAEQCSTHAGHAPDQRERRALLLCVSTVLLLLAGGAGWLLSRTRAGHAGPRGASPEPSQADSPRELDEVPVESRLPGTPKPTRRGIATAATAVAPARALSGSYSGTVISANESLARVTGGRVRLVPVPGRSPEYPPGQLVASIDERGAFDMRGIPLGTWALDVEIVGFEPSGNVVEFNTRFPDHRVRITAVPIRPFRMQVVLRHASGSGLFDALRGEELEMSKALAPVFLAERPAIGSDLPAAARKLVQRSRNVRRPGSDAWMQAAFDRGVDGWACVVMGERVLDAVPFTAGQELVVLTVRSEDLVVPRFELVCEVRDAITNAPLAPAFVRATPFTGHAIESRTAASGTVTVTDLCTGSVRIFVRATDHQSEERVVHVERHESVHVESFALTPVLSIRGRVRYPPSGAVVYSVALVRIGESAREPSASAWSTRNQGEHFELGSLVPDEYMVGISVPAWGLPVASHVRRGEVDGWRVVDLRRAGVDGIELEITEELAAKLRSLEKRDGASPSR